MISPQHLWTTFILNLYRIYKALNTNFVYYTLKKATIFPAFLRPIPQKPQNIFG